MTAPYDCIVDMDSWNAFEFHGPCRLQDFGNRPVFAAMKRRRIPETLSVTAISPSSSGLLVWSGVFKNTNALRETLSVLADIASSYEMVFDAANFAALYGELRDVGPLVEMAPTPTNLAPAVALLPRLLAARKIVHSNFAGMNAAIANTGLRARHGAAGYPRAIDDNEASIDLAVCLFIALARVINLRKSLSMGLAA